MRQDDAIHSHQVQQVLDSDHGMGPLPHPYTDTCGASQQNSSLLINVDHRPLNTSTFLH